MNTTGIQGTTTYGAAYGPTNAGSDFYGAQTAPPLPPAPVNQTYAPNATIDPNVNLRGDVAVPSPSASVRAPAASAGVNGSATVNTPPVQGTVTPPAVQAPSVNITP